ncbi:NHL repeat-containing protein 2 [Folsomia candida]|uniref:NHL repeat-containing protein 2 n=1 Tax=Folsomia candida TaxID=158441 RepID=A0A226DYB0_FOLCA|nr:NHL repeat-containing protein 2 [Folsomia candida]
MNYPWLNKQISKLEKGESTTLPKPIKKLVEQYLDNFYEFSVEDGLIERGRNPLRIEMDKTKLEAINTTELPKLDSLNGNIVLVEFFTHCCINCIHSIEDVREVYEDVTKSDSRNGLGLKIVSIHSPKFTREKELESIKSFTEQFKMDYSDVVNDPGCELWNELGISCWPTLLILGPNPDGDGMNLLFTMMGEGHKHILKLILSSALAYFRHKLRVTGNDMVDGGQISSQRKVPQEETVEKPFDHILRYPGKVASKNGILAIADTGNHRIIVSDLNGSIKHIIGSSQRGYANGTFSQAKFYFPQGVVFKDENVLIIADTGNHAIRQVDLMLGKVCTLVPPGWNYSHDEEIVHLRSPWDVTFFSKEILLVAAAGNHRIFAYFFESSKLFSELEPFDKDTFTVIAGTGKEENRNNAYILKASFAQPSGICVLNRPDNAKVIFIADSESSSIRSITTEGKGKVQAVVGGARDPTDLFSYGDIDGKGVSVKLQHPMGVCSHKTLSQVYFVDTYNNRVKVVDVDSQSCFTLCGNGAPGNVVGDLSDVKFNEPGGICISDNGEILYVADTNNHAIKSINLQSKSVTNIPFKHVEYDDVFSLQRSVNNIISFKICITNIPENFEGGQFRVAELPSNPKSANVTSGEIIKDQSIGIALVEFPANLTQEYSITLDIFLCGPSSCYKKTLKFLLNFNSNHEDSITCFTYKPKENFFNI